MVRSLGINLIVFDTKINQDLIWCITIFGFIVLLFPYRLKLKHKLNLNSNLIKNATQIRQFSEGIPEKLNYYNKDFFALNRDNKSWFDYRDWRLFMKKVRSIQWRFL